MVVSMALFIVGDEITAGGTAYAVWTGSAPLAQRWHRHRAGRIRKPDAYREPRLYCDRHYRAETQRALIALVNPNQFAYVEALPGGIIPAASAVSPAAKIFGVRQPQAIAIRAANQRMAVLFIQHNHVVAAIEGAEERSSAPRGWDRR